MHNLYDPSGAPCEVGALPEWGQKPLDLASTPEVAALALGVLHRQHTWGIELRNSERASVLETSTAADQPTPGLGLDELTLAHNVMCKRVTGVEVAESSG
jgi:hypothetical protein